MKQKSCHKKKFLIIDGHNQMRTLVKQMLKNNAYKNYTVEDNGRTALNLIRKEPFDFIICGWDVPVISGINLLKLVKTSPLHYLTPFILVSKDNSLKSVFYALEEGVDGFLVLPFTEKDFIRLVEKALLETDNPDMYRLKTNQMLREKFNKNYLSAVKIGGSLLKQKTNIRISHLTGECLVELREFGKAEKILKKALDSEKSSKLFHLLGKIYMVAGNTEEAMNYFKLASKENPHNLEGHISLAELYFQEGDLIKANKLISSVMESKPSFLDMIEIGKLLLKFSPSKAGIIFETIHPIEETEHLFLNYAAILSKQGKHKEGICILKKCVDQLPDSYTSYYQLGELYLKTKEFRKAEKCFKKILEMKPDYNLANDYLKKIKEE